MSMGDYNYAPVLRDIVNYYKDIEPSTIPAFIIFITDGDNFDKEETNDIVRELWNPICFCSVYLELAMKDFLISSPLTI